MHPEHKTEQPPGGNPVANKTAQTNNGNKLTKSQRRINLEYEKSFRLLRGFSIGRSLIVWCPFCDSWHIHGWYPENGPETEELRFAHCNESGITSYRISPFRQRHLALVDSRAEYVLGINPLLTELARASRARATGEGIKTSLQSDLRAEWRTENKNRRLEEKACLRAEREAQRARNKELREELKDRDKAARKAAQEGQSHGN
jgi:hypothetical protein